MPRASSNMRQSVEDLLLPILRQRGYRGSWPAMRRPVGDRIDFVTFELDTRRSYLRVALRTAPATEAEGCTNEEAAARFAATYLPVPQASTGANGDAACFPFFTSDRDGAAGTDSVATAVLDALLEHGGPWWEKGYLRRPPSGGSR